MPRLARKGPKILRCTKDGCDELFSTAQLRDDHQMLHDDPAAFKCVLCGTRHHCAKQLADCTKAHEKSTKRYFCEDIDCDLSYTRTNAFRDHKILHEDPFAFTCETCGKPHSSSGNKADCERMHRGTHRCPLSDCQRIFKSPGELSVHSKRHEGILDFVCEEAGCDAAYVTEHGLYLHRCAKHGVSTPKNCKMCNSSYSSVLDLDSHMSTVHYAGFTIFDLADVRIVETMEKVLEQLKAKFGSDLVKTAIKPDRDDRELTKIKAGSEATFWREFVTLLEKENVLLTYDLKRQVRSYYDPTKAQGTNQVSLSGVQKEELKELVLEVGWHRLTISLEMGVSDAVVDSWFLRFGDVIGQEMGMSKTEMLALARTRAFEAL